MSEIEKLYRNAGIEKKRYCEFDDECPYMFGHQCKDCDIDYKPEGYQFPPFTPEKQLELIKLLSKRELYINYQEEKYYIFTMNIGGSAYGKILKETLARYVNKIWSDLSEEERKQIKEILE